MRRFLTMSLLGASLVIGANFALTANAGHEVTVYGMIHDVNVGFCEMHPDAPSIVCPWKEAD